MTETNGGRPAFIKPKQQVEKEAGDTQAQMATQLREFKDRKDQLEDELTEINKAIDALSVELAEEMETHGVTGFKVKGIGSVYIQTVNRPNITDKEAFNEWLDAHGMSAMSPRTVHWKRLESLVKEMLERGEQLPRAISKLDGKEFELVTNFQQKRALIRRA